MENTEFTSALENKVALLEKVIKGYLPEETGLQRRVVEAMNYSVLAGGKRLRPMLIAETYHMCGGESWEESPVAPFLAAIEMIHTYSLVHDDLPAMDNDEYRRGKKTTWAVYGETFGILAGDGLLNLAFETALSAFRNCNTMEEHIRVEKALSVLARNAGIHGMIGGQTVDILAEEARESATEESLLFIHEHKTAKLIEAAMMIGAILAGACDEQIKAIEKCGSNVGIAFQIQDDILDVCGSMEELGKPIGSDEQNHKQTYVTLKGLEQAKKDVERLSIEALSILDGFSGEHAFLSRLIHQLIYRRK